MGTDFTYLEQLLDERWQSKRKLILARDHYKCQMCSGIMSEDTQLHVHHRYYILGKYAWEYDNSALITLCEKCHYIVHKTIHPLTYLKYNDCFRPMNFTPCHRCNGAGYLPEYNYFQGGICFRCNGARYEELINLEKIEINDFITEDNYVYDVPAPCKSIEELKSIFQQGKNYHLGINGVEKSVDKAISQYKIAAISGYGEAQNNLGIIYRDIINDFSKGFRWLVYATMQGIAQAQGNLFGTLERMGKNKDQELTTFYEKLACSKNDDLTSMLAIKHLSTGDFSEDTLELYLKNLIRMYKKGNKHAIIAVEKMLKDKVFKEMLHFFGL